MQTLDGATTVAASTAQGPLLDRSSFSNGGTDYKFQVLGSSATIRPPQGAEPERAMGRILGWRLADGRTIQALDGSTLTVLPDLGGHLAPNYRVSIVDMSANGEALIQWIDGGAGAPVVNYVGLVRGGQLVNAFQAPATLLLFGRVTDSTAFGNVAIPAADGTRAEAPIYPALFDLSSGRIEVLEIYGPMGSSAYDGQRNYVRLVQPGQFWMVSGAGDCLNVRANPATGAKSLGCFVDGVLLREENDVAEADGIRWWKVQTPAGESGWASSQYVATTHPEQ
jgi:hypothetical protein